MPLCPCHRFHLPMEQPLQWCLAGEAQALALLQRAHSQLQLSRTETVQSGTSSAFTRASS